MPKFEGLANGSIGSRPGSLAAALMAMLAFACGSTPTEAPQPRDTALEPEAIPRKTEIIEPATAEPEAAKSEPVRDAGPPPVPGADVPSIIPCKSAKDCWFEFEPLRPAPRPKKLRKKRFVPCRDGETEPVCGDGRCGLVFYEC